MFSFFATFHLVPICPYATVPPPALNSLMAKKEAFTQLEDFNAKKGKRKERIMRNISKNTWHECRAANNEIARTVKAQGINIYMINF